MTKYLLDPLTLDANLPSVNGAPSSNDLKQMLIEIITKSTSCFISHGEYTSIYKSEVITLELKVDLLIRSSTRHAHNRIEILEADEISNGSFGSIRESYGVLVPEKNFCFKKKSLESSRICKVLACDTLEHQIAIIHEDYFTKRNPLLHSKDAVISDNHGYLVMRKAQEQDLFYLNNAIFSNLKRLTIKKRLQITCIIIEALIKQVHEQNMLHCDIKPENIIIDTTRLTATIIDYGFAYSIGCAASDVVNGTVEYIAPELLNIYQPTEKSDMYALGLTIANLWGYNPPANLTMNSTIEEVKAFHRNRKWPFLFRGIYLSADMQYKIKEALENMTAPNPNDRIMPKQSLAQWQKILAEYNESQLTQSCASNFDKISISLESSLSFDEKDIQDNPKKIPIKLLHFFKPQASNSSNSQEEDIFENTQRM